MNSEILQDPAIVYGFLRDKVKSKMDVAKLLGTFLTGVLGVILALKREGTGAAELSQSVLSSPVLLLAVTFVVAAIILFFATMLAYDRLLMPLHYWDDKDERNNDALQRYMVDASVWLFVPASICLGVGLSLFLYAVLSHFACLLLLVFGGGVAALIYAWFFTRKPRFHYP